MDEETRKSIHIWLDSIEKEIKKETKVVTFDSLSSHITGNKPQIQYLDYNPITNQVEVEEVSHETFFNTDYSDLENRIIGTYPDIIIGDEIMEFKLHPKSMSIDEYDPDPLQKWVQPGPKYQRYNQRVAEAVSKKTEQLRKRKLNKANRKRARNG